MKRNASAIAAKKAFLARWKLAAGCIDCGYVNGPNGEPAPEALEWDHIVPFSGGSMGPHVNRTSWAPLLAETALCVVRCGSCHNIRTARGAA